MRRVFGSPCILLLLALSSGARGTGSSPAQDQKTQQKTVKQLCELLHDTNPNERHWAQGELVKRGPSSVSELIKLLDDDDPEVSNISGVLLSEIGRPAVGALVKRLDDRNASRQRIALGILRQMKNKEAAPAVPSLLKVLKQQDVILRTCAIDALSKTGEPAAFQAVLDAARNDPEIGGRIAAIEGIPQFGALAHQAIPVLRGFVRSRDPDICQAAISALAEVGGKAQEILLSIAKERSNDTSLRATAVSAICWRSPDCTAVDALAGLLKDPDPTFRTRVADNLSVLGSKAKGAVPALVDVARSDTTSNRISAARALSKIDPDNRISVDTLVELLKEKKSADRIRVLNVLAEMGHGAKRAVPALIEILDSERDEKVWKAANRALALCSE
jgi:HEAT repeat protein